LQGFVQQFVVCFLTGFEQRLRDQSSRFDAPDITPTVEGRVGFEIPINARS
jgi:hypothetical protein